MPPRLIYWTGTWDPEREAHSRQIEALRRSGQTGAGRAGGLVVSSSQGQRTRWLPRDGVIRLAGRRWALLRLVARAVEPFGDVHHLFGALDSWHLLRCRRRRPTLFTVTMSGTRAFPELYRPITRFAAETESIRALLRAAAVPDERIEVVAPGVDLERFRPQPAPPSRPFRLLFASSPADPRELEARGVPLLVELARALRDVEVCLLWRSWGDVEAGARAVAALDPPANVRFERGDRRDMPDVYRDCHATVIAYAAGFGRSAPLSIVESLACGRPALLTETCGLAETVAAAGAGAVESRDLAGLVRAVERLRSDYTGFSRRARALAEERFALSAFLAAYDRVHSSLARPAR